MNIIDVPGCTNVPRHRAFGWVTPRPDGGNRCWSCTPAGMEADMLSSALTPDAALRPDTLVTPMSVGLPPPDLPPAPMLPPIGRRVCPHCGSRFQPKRAGQVWCRDRCRKNAYDRRAYARKVQAQGRVYRPRPMAERGWANALLQDE